MDRPGRVKVEILGRIRTGRKLRATVRIYTKGEIGTCWDTKGLVSRENPGDSREVGRRAMGRGHNCRRCAPVQQGVVLKASGRVGIRMPERLRDSTRELRGRGTGDALLSLSRLVGFRCLASHASPARTKGGGKASECYGKVVPTKSLSDQYFPTTILEFSNANQRGKVHPTQKPVALMEYLIRTYTQEGETVLDNCMGSGTTGVACINTGRKFIGIERDQTYFEIASKRLAAISAVCMTL